MSRNVQDMEPTRLDRALSQYADIKLPEECDEPILTPAVRTALREWMIEISDAKELEKASVPVRHNALLYGPPGCGKTTFAHHFAARLGLPLLLVRTEDLFGNTLGDTPKKFADLFHLLDDRNKNGRHYVVFLDEIDSIATHRGSADSCNQELARALNVMLRWVEAYQGIVISATNREREIDTALWRRFDLQIQIELPGEDERFAILRRYLAPYDMPDEDIDSLVDLTDGASPALLKNLMTGVKRTLILGPKLKWDTRNYQAIFEGLTSSISPPTDTVFPPLWNHPSPFPPLHWPPTLKEAS